MVIPACTTTVHSDGATSLPATGLDAGVWMPLAIIAAALIVAGFVLILFRHRRAHVVAALAVLGIVAGATLASAPAAQAADTPQTCSLLRVEAVDAQMLAGLVPGDSAGALRYRVTNVTGAPIDIRVNTVVTSDAGGLGHDIDTVITLDGRASTTEALSDEPSSTTVRVAPGASVSAVYTLTLASTVDNSKQGQTVRYDSVITALQP